MADKSELDITTEIKVYGRGDHAEAESAVPGWTMAVEDLFFG